MSFLMSRVHFYKGIQAKHLQMLKVFQSQIQLCIQILPSLIE